MVRSVYRTEFDPLALPREHIGIFYAGKWEFYRVEYVDSIQPFRLDFGSITAGSSTVDIDLSSSSYLGEPEEDTLLELKVTPISDVEIEVKNPGAIPLHYATDVIGVTKISKKIATHNNASRFTATGNQGPIWQVTSNRIAKVKRLVIANESASDLWAYLTNSAGTRKSASFRVSATSSLVLGEDDIGLETAEDIYINIDTQPVSVHIEVEEKAIEDYNNLQVMYVMQDRVPTFKLTNPTDYNISESIVEFYGYKYYLTAVEKEPEKWTFVPLGGYGGLVASK